MSLAALPPALPLALQPQQSRGALRPRSCDHGISPAALCQARAWRPRDAAPLPREAIAMNARRALVTGGSRGIGASIARALAESGHRVAVHCRADTSAADAVAAALP